MCQTRLVFLLILTLSHHVHCANILVIVSLPLRSHYMAFQQLFRELAVRGHSVIVLNNFPDNDPIQNLTFINLKQYNNSASTISPLSSYETFDSTYLHWYNLYRHIVWSPQSMKLDCTTLFTHEEVKALHEKGKKFDVIFVEQFLGDCGLVYAAAMYDAPIIGITSHVLLPLSYSRLGIPFDYSADSFYFSKSGPNPSFYTKIENIVMAFIYNTAGRIYIQRTIYEVFDKYIPNNNIDIERVAQERIKMMFVYQHFSLTGARLLPPQVLEIGGVHIGKTKPLPVEIEKFMQTAEHGVIYVSFGSNLKANTMSQYKFNEFLKAFKKIPQKVLWKYENKTLPAGHEKVYFSTWLPQLDILCHTKVLGFVSHGGMLSLSEAAHCGKPVLTIPFFGDQFSNTAAARSSGLGKVLYFDRLNADNLAEGMKELTSQEMHQTAKRISKLWHDRPVSVMDNAIYWTEYVARHGTAPPSLPSKQTTWWQAVQLDVATVIILLVIFLLALLHILIKFVKFVCNKLYKRKPKSD